MGHTAAYLQVINSPRWRSLRKKLYPKDNACAHCKKCGYTLELHHKTYERLGHERDEDVEFLCPYCHAKADKIRAEQGRQRSADALYDARLNGWARKKYGDDWDQITDYESLCAEFDEWVERKNDWGYDGSDDTNDGSDEEF